MKKNILHIQDNDIYYYSHKYNKIYIKKIKKNSLKLGKISDPKLFYEEFNRFLNENKLMNTILTENIIIIIHDNYTKADKMILSDILDKLNYKKIEYIKDKTILALKSNKIYINYNNDYTILYYKNKMQKEEIKFIDNKVFNVQELIQYINSISKTKDRLIFGNNEKIKSIFNGDKDFIYICFQTILIDLVFKSNT